MPSCCLNEASCSSSTTIRPSLGSGANTASRVPTTKSASPCAADAGQCRSNSVLELRRQIDLRYQHQCLPARGNDARCGSKVDLGLAASGHALEQCRGELLRIAQDRVERCLLIGVERLRSAR